MARRKHRRPCHKSAFKADLRKAVKSFLIIPAGSCCQACNYAIWPGNLSFHHKDETTKNFNISEKLVAYTIRTLIREASKCIVICHNCHGEVHAGLRSVGHIKVLDYSSMKIPLDIIKWYRMRKLKAG